MDYLQGASDGQHETFDVESVAGHLLQVGTVFARLTEHRCLMFPESAFANRFNSGCDRP